VMTMTTAMFLPAGLATTATPAAFAIAAVTLVAKTAVLAVFLGLVEASYAKLRLFRLPQFLGVGFVTGFLALALRIL